MAHKTFHGLILIGTLFLAAFFTSCSKDSSTSPAGSDGTTTPPTTTPDGWTVQIVDEKVGTQYVSAVNGEINAATDSQGKLHISYFDATLNGLKYATNKSGSWSVVTIDVSNVSVNIAGEMNDIAVDQSGNAHICYHNADNNVADANVESLRYATNASGVWVKTDVYPPAAGVVFAENNICVDNSGTIHLAYERGNSSIGYAKKSTGNWTTETACQFSAFTTDLSMALDPSGAPVVAYTSNYGLNVAHRAGTSSWIASLIVGTQGVNHDASFPALAIQANGTQYVVYQDLTEDKIWLSTNGALTQLCANAGKGFFSMPAIVIDGSGKYHISYCSLNTTDWTIHYVTNKSGSLVDTPLSIRAKSGGSAIGIDNAGKVSIVYANTPRGSLCVATK